MKRACINNQTLSTLPLKTHIYTFGCKYILMFSSTYVIHVRNSNFLVDDILVRCCSSQMIILKRIIGGISQNFTNFLKFSFYKRENNNNKKQFKILVG